MMPEVITPNWELKTELQSTRAALLSLQEEHKILLEKQSVLKMMFTDVRKKKQIPKDATIYTVNEVCTNILNVVSNVSEIPLEDMLSLSRKSEIVGARNVAAYLLRNKTRLSYSEVGKKLSFSRPKNHATMIYAVKMVENSYQVRNKVKFDADGLCTLSDKCLMIIE